MPTSSRGLLYDVVDIRPPWRAPGRPVVFHHGVGTNRDIWAAWLPVVAAQLPVVRFDLRGFGDSVAALPEDPSVLLDVLIEDLFDVVPTAEPVHLVGESAGGTVVLAAALRHPQRVASVTISNAAFVGSKIGQIDGWRRLFDEKGMKGWSDRMMECRFAPGATDSASAAWFSTQQERATASASLVVADMLAGTDLTSELPGLRVPLLILAPDSSPFVPLSSSTDLHALVPGSELRVFPGVRHGLPFSHAEECARILLDFLQRRSPP